MAPPSRQDPQGYYAVLGLEPAATQEAITHAFRRKALRLHPDVPKTGNKDAFLALRAAYDVLSDPDRRRGYDEAARAPEPPPASHYAPPHGAHDFRPNVADAPWVNEDLFRPAPGFTPRPARPPRDDVRPRFPTMQVAAGVGIIAVLCVGVVEAVLNLRTAPVASTAGITPTAPPVAPQPLAAQRAALYGPPPVRLAGTPNFFVVPSAGPTMMWRQEKDRGSMSAIGQLPPFSSVQALRVSKQTGLVEVRFDDNSSAFVDARHLAPGDAAAARRAYCSYNAGPVPYDGEVLERRGQGSGTLRIENRGVQPAVVKLRDPQGAVALAVYLAPNGVSDLSDVPGGPLQAEYAIGELWSRACNTFAAGLRARRLNGRLAQSAAGTLALPTPEGSATDMPDQAFALE